MTMSDDIVLPGGNPGAEMLHRALFSVLKYIDSSINILIKIHNRLTQSSQTKMKCEKPYGDGIQHQKDL